MWCNTNQPGTEERRPVSLPLGLHGIAFSLDFLTTSARGAVAERGCVAQPRPCQPGRRSQGVRATRLLSPTCGS